MAEPYRYDPSEIEPRWQRVWADERTWEVSNEPDGREEAYVLEMLPYPSGEPHLGHLKNYAIGDAVAHFWRRQGFRVLHPIGYDAFGLPAENHAISTGQHPRDSTNAAIASFREQFREWGVSFDWSRELATHDPRYYRWTQWIFLKLFERGLAYRAEAAVKWCPNDQTVLANEQVIDGRCERCGHEVEVRQLTQWFFRITDYADRLLEDLDTIDWPAHVKTMQRNWIGRSEGAEVTFRNEELGIDYPVFTTRPDTLFGATFFRITDYADRLLEDLDTIDWPAHVKTMQRNWIGRSEGAEVTFRNEELGIDYPVFTTRPDTLFGATFFVMAPEHPDVFRLVEGTEQQQAVHAYVNHVLTEGNEDRGDADREKTGVFLGRYVVNPVNGERLPMYVADYVLMEYGTGAIMAVPAHDARDHEFARKFDLPIREVVAGGEDVQTEAYTGDGPLVNSHSDFDGLPNREALDAIVTWLDREGQGHVSVNYRLRDWLLSRQRYWGCPIPIIHCERCGIVPVPEDELPVVLPDVADYAPKGRSPLAAAEDWVNVSCPSCDGPAQRETDTMDTFVDSSWYFMRYADPHNDEAPWDPEVLARWMPIDQYIGGVEHAILHLLYARFFTKALADLGYLNFQEPFARLFTQGMITRDGAKMSKSRGNVISPQSYVERYGADTLRAYIMFIGPPDQDADWSDTGVEGVHRFLARLWRMSADAAEHTPDHPVPDELSASDLELLRKAHWAIEKITNDMAGRFAFNTAIAAIMELTNTISKQREEGDPSPGALRFALSTAASLLFPFAPHTAADAYERLTGARVWEEPWPAPDQAFLERDTYELVCQVNGKVRDRVEAPTGAAREELEALCLAMPKVQAHIDGKDVVKVVVVPERLVNVVVR